MSTSNAPPDHINGFTAGTIVYAAEFGSPPDASELTVLNQFTQAQFDYGQQIGVMDPSVYAYQSLGVALATGQHFQNEFGPSNSMYSASAAGDALFVTDAYAIVFGHAGTAAQVQQFADQLNYFETCTPQRACLAIRAILICWRAAPSTVRCLGLSTNQ